MSESQKPIDDGGDAFPRVETNPDIYRNQATDMPEVFGNVASVGGMSLRDYFAAATAVGFGASFHGLSRAEIVKECYDFADAMIAEKRRTEGGVS